jgi:hypothetical protein
MKQWWQLGVGDVAVMVVALAVLVWLDRPVGWAEWLVSFAAAFAAWFTVAFAFQWWRSR